METCAKLEARRMLFDPSLASSQRGAPKDARQSKVCALARTAPIIIRSGLTCGRWPWQAVR
jgi:hypothetical protein